MCVSFEARGQYDAHHNNDDDMIGNRSTMSASTTAAASSSRAADKKAQLQNTIAMVSELRSVLQHRDHRVASSTSSTDITGGGVARVPFLVVKQD